MSSDSGSTTETLGTLLFFRKNEESKTTPYHLYAGETTIGGSNDADVRLRLTDERLSQIHCVIDVEENGKVSNRIINVNYVLKFVFFSKFTVNFFSTLFHHFQMAYMQV